MLPPIYIDAAVRSATQACPVRHRLGLSFDVSNGQVLRLALDAESALALRELLDGYISSFAGTQSPGSFLVCVGWRQTLHRIGLGRPAVHLESTHA